MRTLMMLASVAMIGSGIFCIANGTAAFLTVAFIIGLVFIVLGAVELVVSGRADFDASEMGVSITKDGVIMLLLGAAVITGQITDDLSAQTLFATLLMIEGVLSFREDSLDIMSTSRDQRVGIGLNILMMLLGIYMFFNTTVFHFPVTLLVGICLVVLGLRRFAQSFRIEYIRPGFVTGNEERLREAQEDEKRALAKAKEGIREQKNAQRRISKIKEDIAAEQDVLMSAAVTRQERAAEREMEE